MNHDEQAIRDVVAAWMLVSAAGDAEGHVPRMAEPGGNWVISRDANLLGE